MIPKVLEEKAPNPGAATPGTDLTFGDISYSQMQ
eukprot:gene43280-64445_t